MSTENKLPGQAVAPARTHRLAGLHGEAVPLGSPLGGSWQVELNSQTPSNRGPKRRCFLQTRTSGSKEQEGAPCALHGIPPREEGMEKPEFTGGETEARQGKTLPKFHSLEVRVSHQWEPQRGQRQDEASFSVP